MEPFIGVDDLEAILDAPLADPNALIVSIALDSACAAVRSYLDQTINFVADDVAVLDGNGRQRIRLPQRPVRAVTEVMIDDTVVDPTEYFVRRSVIWMPEEYFTEGIGNVEVTYDHGWDTVLDSSGDGEFVPADIRLVALLSARRVYTAVGESSTAGLPKISETIGEYAYQLAGGAAEAIQSVAQLIDAEKAVIEHWAIRSGKRTG